MDLWYSDFSSNLIGKWTQVSSDQPL